MTDDDFLVLILTKLSVSTLNNIETHGDEST
jgi:hypothetical protein